MAGEDTGIQAYASLGDDVNKLDKSGTEETKEGVVSQKLPVLSLDMKDDDLVKLADKWEKDWKDSPKKTEWDTMCDDNEKYWLGKHFDTPKADKSRANVDNLIFESLETYLPQVTRRNPEPLVEIAATDIDPSTGSPSPVQLKYVDKVKSRLSDLADVLKFRLKLKKAARHWAIFLIGVAKFGWDLDRDIPAIRIVRPRKILLDPDATIDEDGYTGDRIGEYRKLTAEKILKLIEKEDDFEKKKKAIMDMVKDDQLATELQFIEWWTPQYFCWKLGKTILLKKKNPHWNYDEKVPTESVDAYGNATQAEEDRKGINHLPVPEMPYKFLTVFNLGDQPMDKTSLITQNLANQDRINKRNKQIDKNADSFNAGVVVSLARAGLTKSEAKSVTDALRKGGTVVIPDGAPEEAIKRMSINGLPPDVYNDLVDTRNRLRDIFGTKGNSPAGIENEKTVGGKIITKSLDTDRIGGGVSEYLEQFADDCYNWLLQLLYVYDPAFAFVEGAKPPKVLVSVKEGSLLPKDSLAIANQALELARMNKISNIDLYKKLEYPNPDEMAANVWLEQNAPQLLYKDNQLVQEAFAAMQQAKAAEAAAKQAGEMGKINAKNEGEIRKEVIKSAIPSPMMASGP